MNKLEEDLKRQIHLVQEESRESTIEKAQRENTERLSNFIYGAIIWIVSLTILSMLQKSFRLVILIVIFLLEIVINLAGKIYNIDSELLLKIRLTGIYVVIILVLMIIA